MLAAARLAARAAAPQQLLRGLAPQRGALARLTGREGGGALAGGTFAGGTCAPALPAGTRALCGHTRVGAAPCVDVGAEGAFGGGVSGERSAVAVGGGPVAQQRPPDSLPSTPDDEVTVLLAAVRPSVRPSLLKVALSSADPERALRELNALYRARAREGQKYRDAAETEIMERDYEKFAHALGQSSRLTEALPLLRAMVREEDDDAFTLARALAKQRPSSGRFHEELGALLRLLAANGLAAQRRLAFSLAMRIADTMERWGHPALLDFCQAGRLFGLLARDLADRGRIEHPFVLAERLEAKVDEPGGCRDRLAVNYRTFVETLVHELVSKEPAKKKRREGWRAAEGMLEKLSFIIGRAVALSPEKAPWYTRQGMRMVDAGMIDAATSVAEALNNAGATQAVLQSLVNALIDACERGGPDVDDERALSRVKRILQAAQAEALRRSADAEGAIAEGRLDAGLDMLGEICGEGQQPSAALAAAAVDALWKEGRQFEALSYTDIFVAMRYDDAVGASHTLRGTRALQLDLRGVMPRVAVVRLLHFLSREVPSAALSQPSGYFITLGDAEARGLSGGGHETAERVASVAQAMASLGAPFSAVGVSEVELSADKDELERWLKTSTYLQRLAKGLAQGEEGKGAEASEAPAANDGEPARRRPKESQQVAHEHALAALWSSGDKSGALEYMRDLVALESPASGRTLALGGVCVLDVRELAPHAAALRAMHFVRAEVPPTHWAVKPSGYRIVLAAETGNVTKGGGGAARGVLSEADAARTAAVHETIRSMGSPFSSVGVAQTALEADAETLEAWTKLSSLGRAPDSNVK